MRVWSSTSRVAPSRLQPGEDLVLDARRADTPVLRDGALLDDHLDQDVRRALDEEAERRLAAWRAWADDALTVDGLPLAHVYERELLIDVFVRETRRVTGLATALTALGASRVELHGLDRPLHDCAVATLAQSGIEAHAAAPPDPEPRYPIGFATPKMTPLRRVTGAVRTSLGVPARPRGRVFVSPHWHLAPLLGRLAETPELHPLLDLTRLPRLESAELVRLCREGGWVGHPHALDRVASRRRLRRTLDAPAPAWPDPLARFLDLRARSLLAQRADDALARAERMRRSFVRAGLRVAIVPSDSAPDGRLIVWAARGAGAASVYVQHGFNGGRLDPGAGPPTFTEGMAADHAAVWAAGDAEFLGRGSSSEIHPIGNPGVPPLPDPRRAAAVQGRTVVLVQWPSEGTTRIDVRISLRHAEAALAGLAEARPGTAVVMRPHPDDPEPEIYTDAAARHPGLQVTVDAATPIDDLLAGADLCVGALSTAALQACAAGVPTVMLNTSGVPFPWPFDGNSALPLATSAEELAAAVPGALSADAVPGRDDALEALGVKAGALDALVDLVRRLGGTTGQPAEPLACVSST